MPGSAGWARAEPVDDEVGVDAASQCAFLAVPAPTADVVLRMARAPHWKTPTALNVGVGRQLALELVLGAEPWHEIVHCPNSRASFQHQAPQ